MFKVTINERVALFEDLWDAMKWFFMHSSFKVTDSPDLCKNVSKLYSSKDQLLAYSGWNKEKYKLSGWYGDELVLCKDIPKELYKELIQYIYFNYYCNIKFRNADTPFKEWHEEVIKRLEVSKNGV